MYTYIYDYICIYESSAVHLKLTQYYKSTTLQFRGKTLLQCYFCCRTVLPCTALKPEQGIIKSPEIPISVTEIILGEFTSMGDKYSCSWNSKAKCCLYPFYQAIPGPRGSSMGCEESPWGTERKTDSQGSPQTNHQCFI